MGAFISFSAVLLLYGVIAELAVRRGRRTEQDYLTGGRASGRLLVALSAGAASASGFVMLGAVGSGYTMGIAAVLIPVAWFFGDLAFWSLFPARIHRLSTQSGCNTVPALLAVAAADRSRLPVRSLAALCIVVFVGLYASAQLLAAGKTMNALFPIPLSWGIAASAVIVVAYCARGGLRASIWTNAMQAVVMLLTTTGMLGAIVVHCGGVTEAFEALSSLHPQLLDPLHVSGTWPLLIVFLAGFTAAAVGFDLSTPQLLVRIMAGRSSHEAASAKWYYLAFMQITWASMALFGLLARLALPEMGDPEQALPVFAAAELSPWITGLVLAGMFSAIASTLEGQMLVISSSLAVDIAPALHDRLLAALGERVDVIVTFLVGGLLAAVTLSQSATVFDLIVFAANALSSAFAPMMLVVLYGLRTSPAALKAAMCAGILVAVSWRAAGWHGALLEALPGIVAGLFAHAAVVRSSAPERRARTS
jgi:sodium/proline symporter